MANPKIEVEIGAVIDGLRKGFGESVKIIETLEKQALELDKALRAATDLPTIQNLNSQLAQTKSAISQLKNSGIDPLTKATSNYNSVGTDFARIIQDAPFGIIGVGNNITQLAQSFQVLKSSTGSTKAALVQSFQSIFSSGNALLLGVSLLTTGLTILQQQGFFKSAEAAKTLAERLEDYEKTLNSVNSATLDGVKNSEQELQKFRALVAQAENVEVSDKKRLAAVNELQKQYPQYLKNLTDEQILTGQVGDAYDILTKQIIANAKAKAFSDEITQNTKDIRTLEKEQIETVNKILEKRIELQNAEAKSTESALKVAGQLAAADLTVSRIESELNDLIQKQIKSIKDSNDAKQSNLDINKLINEELKNGAVFTNENTDARNANTEALDNWKKKAEDIQRILDTEAFLESREIKFDLNVEKFTKQIKEAFPEEKEIEVKIKTDIEIPQEIADIDESKLTAFVLRLKEFNAQVYEILENGAQQTLGDFAFAIGDALASGGNVIKAAGAALLGGLAGILNQLGQLAIATGLAVEGIKKALQTLNPAVAIGAGIALVALAGFVSNKAKSLGSSKGGGGGGGGGSSVGGSGVGGGSSFVGGGAQGGMFAANKDLNGELVVRGQDLVYVFGQANNRINKG